MKEETMVDERNHPTVRRARAWWLMQGVAVVGAVLFLLGALVVNQSPHLAVFALVAVLFGAGALVFISRQRRNVLNEYRYEESDQQ